MLRELTWINVTNNTLNCHGTLRDLYENTESRKQHGQKKRGQTTKYRNFLHTEEKSALLHILMFLRSNVTLYSVLLPFKEGNLCHALLQAIIASCLFTGRFTRENGASFLVHRSFLMH